MTARRMARFLSMAVMAERHGSGGGDSRADGAVPGHGSDDDNIEVVREATVWSQWWRRSGMAWRWSGWWRR
jgi:hypothetical protein